MNIQVKELCKVQPAKWHYWAEGKNTSIVIKYKYLHRAKKNFLFPNTEFIYNINKGSVEGTLSRRFPNGLIIQLIVEKPRDQWVKELTVNRSHKCSPPKAKDIARINDAESHLADNLGCR